MGIQFYKVMHTLEDLKALSRWQTGGRVGQGTDIALLEAQLIQEYCWMTDTELHRALEDKKRAYDSPSHQGGLDMAMDRMAVPYSLIMLSTKLVLRSFRPASMLLKRDENWLSFDLLVKPDMLSRLNLI